MRTFNGLAVSIAVSCAVAHAGETQLEVSGKQEARLAFPPKTEISVLVSNCDASTEKAWFQVECRTKNGQSCGTTYLGAVQGAVQKAVSPYNGDGAIIFTKPYVGCHGILIVRTP